MTSREKIHVCCGISAKHFEYENEEEEEAKKRFKQKSHIHT